MNGLLADHIDCVEKSHVACLGAPHIASPVCDLACSDEVLADLYVGSVAGFVAGAVAHIVDGFVAVHVTGSPAVLVVFVAAGFDGVRGVDYLAVCVADFASIHLACLVDFLAGVLAGFVHCCLANCFASLVAGVIAGLVTYYPARIVVECLAVLFAVLVDGSPGGPTASFDDHVVGLSASSCASFLTLLAANSLCGSSPG